MNAVINRSTVKTLYVPFFTPCSISFLFFLPTQSAPLSTKVNFISFIGVFPWPVLQTPNKLGENHPRSFLRNPATKQTGKQINPCWQEQEQKQDDGGGDKHESGQSIIHGGVVKPEFSYGFLTRGKCTFLQSVACCLQAVSGLSAVCDIITRLTHQRFEMDLSGRPVTLHPHLRSKIKLVPTYVRFSVRRRD